MLLILRLIQTVATVMATLRRQFGKRLREIRLGRGLSQEDLAEILDCSVDFVSMVERGISAPSFETLEQMSRKLKIPVHAFFAFD